MLRSPNGKRTTKKRITKLLGLADVFKVRDPHAHRADSVDNYFDSKGNSSQRHMTYPDELRIT